MCRDVAQDVPDAYPDSQADVGSVEDSRPPTARVVQSIGSAGTGECGADHQGGGHGAESNVGENVAVSRSEAGECHGEPGRAHDAGGWICPRRKSQPDRPAVGPPVRSSVEGGSPVHPVPCRDADEYIADVQWMTLPEL